MPAAQNKRSTSRPRNKSKSRRSSSPRNSKNSRKRSTSPRAKPASSKSKTQTSRSRSPKLERFGPVLTASTLGSILGSTFGSGSGCAAKMYRGRDPNSGEIVNSSAVEDNPCRRELESLLDCSRRRGDALLCQQAVENLKNCAQRNRAYFES